MSGHSKWHKIKHQKEATDKKKGQLFGKLSREIATAARSEKDPAKNAALRDAIARAKKANVPQANIDRLLSGADKPMATVTYEGFGPGGSSMLIIIETDNGNRTVGELRLMMRDHGGNLGDPGSVRWKFTPQHELLPNFPPLVLSSEDQTKLTALITALEAHPDIVSVYTDTAS